MGAVPPLLPFLLGARGRLQHVQQGSLGRPVASFLRGHSDCALAGVRAMMLASPQALSAFERKQLGRRDYHIHSSSSSSSDS
eukprot:1599272-Pyramimonas_sp.AAC.1